MLKKQNLWSEVALLESSIPFVLCTELRHIIEGMTNIMQSNKNEVMACRRGASEARSKQASKPPPRRRRRISPPPPVLPFSGSSRESAAAALSCPPAAAALTRQAIAASAASRKDGDGDGDLDWRIGAVLPLLVAV